MPVDSVVKVTSKSWGSRLGGSCGGVVFGVILFFVAFPILFWNEGRAVKTAKSLAEGASSVVSIAADSISPANEGKLVHLTAQAATEETLTDPLTGVSAKALRLIRDVEMYQWEESSSSTEKKKLGGGTETTTTYTYSKKWSSSAINSSTFQETAGHENPGDMPFQGEAFTATEALVGAFNMTPSQIASIPAGQTVSPAAEEASLPEGMIISGNMLYQGENSASPQIGDIRIQYKAAMPQIVSIIAQQAGNTFCPYQTKVGRSIDLLTPGSQSADAMFQSEMASNTMLTWVLRLVGIFMMFIGLTMVFEPIGVLADVLPFLGSMMRLGTGMFAAALSLPLALITIAIAWLVYRPLLGIILLAIAGAIIFLAIKAGRKRAPAIAG